MSLERGNICIYEHGKHYIVEWRIAGYSTLDEDEGARYRSPEFSFDGETWRWEIAPNGATSGHVDLWLYKCRSGRSIRLPLFVSLKTAKGEQNGTKDFDGDWVHRFNRFLQTAELTLLSSDLLPDDVLVVACIIKRRSSAESESDSASAEISSSVSDSAGCSSDSGECRHCNGNFAAGILSSHQRKCKQRPVKCPDCSKIVVLQKFLNEHDCYHERPEENVTGRKHKENSENTSMDASTQTEEDSAQSLCELYKKVLFGGCHHDLILKVGDKELRAHRDILRVRSKVFESMLDHNMKEKNTGVIDVPDCDPDAMELFLSYVYCGKIEALDHGNMLGLYYVADKYEMMELKTECSDFIRKSLSVNNICSVIQLALNHSDSELLDCATGYFTENMVDIMQTVEWQTFLRENSTVGNELLLKSVKKLQNA